MNPAHRALREGTRAEHARVDALFARFDLTVRESYADFLAAHAGALIPLEAALDGEADTVVNDWPQRRRTGLLLDDLAALNRGFDGGNTPRRVGAPAIAGLLYVLEGSRHGARMLVQRVPGDFPRRYLGVVQAPELWRNLMDRLDAVLHQPERLQLAIDAARDGFAAFERSGTRWLKG